MIIKKGPNNFVLMSKDGKKTLGHHSSAAAAKSQEAAINISKARKSGNKIPKKK
jgi:hypothetical protein